MNEQTPHIPSGYKPSPLGPIPEDWEVKRLGDIAEITSGTTPSRDNSSFYSNGTIPWVKTTDLNNGILNKTEELITEAAVAQTSLRLLPTGTVLVAMYGGFNQIGRTALLGINATVNQALSALVCKQGVLNSYVLAWLNCKVGDWKRLAASSRKDPNITGKDVERFPILIPKMEEQQRIVSVLSLWDTAIAKQTALIEQLTLRKRGLMQQLLTGKKRLKGFSREWKEVRLGEVGKFAGGCAFNEQEQGGHTGIPFYKVSDMNLSGNESKMNIANNYVTHEQIERLGYIVIEDEAIIFAKVGAAIALERKRYAKNFIIDNNMLAYIPSNNVWFMKYWFDSISLSKYIQVGALPSYNASDLSIIKLKMPSLKEQHAIASVLVNADKEIEIQKQKLAAMQAQKKGLMRVLLTGERRII